MRVFNSEKMQTDIQKKLDVEAIDLATAAKQMQVPGRMLNSLIEKGNAKIEVWILAALWLDRDIADYINEGVTDWMRDNIKNLAEINPQYHIDHLQKAEEQLDLSQALNKPIQNR